MPRMLAVHVRIAVHADLIAEFAAQHLVQGHAVGLARQVPQRDLHAGYPAALA
ncbi:hypothetical protein SDC9_210719 [bioreactor metagenome]|uniref:Uncharacterized protein n=1 Tax=bioreactor metagenome TaxID=1076179 RepID=A0A645JHQ5_9ZZZZ